MKINISLVIKYKKEHRYCTYKSNKRKYLVMVAGHVDRLIVIPDNDSRVLRVDSLKLAPLKLCCLLLAGQGDVVQPVLAHGAGDAQLPVSHVIQEIHGCEQVVHIDLECWFPNCFSKIHFKNLSYNTDVKKTDKFWDPCLGAREEAILLR